MVDRSPIYRRNPAVVVEDFGERSLALHCTDLRLVELNVTARALLTRLEEPASLAQVAAAIAADYQQPEDALRQDLRRIVAHMIDLGLVEQVV